MYSSDLAGFDGEDAAELDAVGFGQFVLFGEALGGFAGADDHDEVRLAEFSADDAEDAACVEAEQRQQEPGPGEEEGDEGTAEVEAPEEFEEHERDAAEQALLEGVAEDDAGRLVGWSALNPYHARPGFRFTTENSVYVAADQRGRGLGKLLLAPLIDAARARGLHAIIAAIDATNEASLRLHRQFGFVQVGHFKQVGYKFDRWLDLVYLERLVD